jgi:hypothetical protein
LPILEELHGLATGLYWNRFQPLVDKCICYEAKHYAVIVDDEYASSVHVHVKTPS